MDSLERFQPHIFERPVKRANILIGFLASSTFAIFLLNCIFPLINLGDERFELPTFEPFIHPVGTDFREGMFYPAKILLQGKSSYIDYNLIYPPFLAVCSIPFRLLYGLVPLLLWEASLFWLWRKERIAINTILLFTLSTPLMKLIPV